MDRLVDVAIQVPAIAMVSFVFLRVFEALLNRQGERMDTAAAALKALADRIDKLEDACLRILTRLSAS